MEAKIESKDFGTSLEDEEGTVKGDTNEEKYPGLTDSPEIDEIIDNSDKEMAANDYDQYIGAEVVLHDRKDEKLIFKVRKRIKYDKISTR